MRHRSEELHRLRAGREHGHGLQSHDLPGLQRRIARRRCLRRLDVRDRSVRGAVPRLRPERRQRMRDQPASRRPRQLRRVREEMRHRPPLPARRRMRDHLRRSRHGLRRRMRQHLRTRRTASAAARSAWGSGRRTPPSRAAARGARRAAPGDSPTATETRPTGASAVRRPRARAAPANPARRS